MITHHESYGIIGRETMLHDTGLHDSQGRVIHYETTIEAIGDPQNPTVPRTWRVSGRQLRAGHPLGRPCAPKHVYSVREARTMARTLFHKHRRYVERNVARTELKRRAAEEDIMTVMGNV